VLDSVGCGELPDAATYGDEGSDTLGNIARQVPLRLPRLRALGLDRVSAIGPRSVRLEADLQGRPADQPPPVPGAYGRMAEASPGKDSVTGHWEMMGIVLDRPFPTFPQGFSPELIAEFERRIGRGTIGNVVASGTAIIDRLGADHMRTGRPIVYTSADSVFQIAAHEEVIPIDEQHRICEIAFDMVGRGLGVGRVIARPFVGTPGTFKRTANRHDYALEPFGDTLLDLLTREHIPVVAVGKTSDLFAGRGIGRRVPTSSDREGVDSIVKVMAETDRGLVFANLVDFDTQYGHRNDVAGYAANLERFDDQLGTVLDRVRDDDLLVITADHGNDPTTPSTDHSREHVPLLVSGRRVRRGVDLGTRRTFADLGQTLADIFGVGPLKNGVSFLDALVGPPEGGHYDDRRGARPQPGDAPERSARLQPGDAPERSARLQPGRGES
jgi:phosphopentomutase